jgi:small subunit ribosomal protein S3
MGQKIHPFAFRLGPQFNWKSRWFASGDRYRKLVQQDNHIRKVLMNQLKLAGITDVQIERSLKNITIRLFVTRPGVVIGRGGSGIEELRKNIMKMLEVDPNDSKAIRVDLPVEEVKAPDLNAHLVATRIAEQLARRMPHRRVIKKTMGSVMGAGAKGVQIVLSGRINGAEIGRTEKYSEGSVPKQTIRANIDYAEIPSLTKSGYVGVKVWIHKDVE